MTALTPEHVHIWGTDGCHQNVFCRVCFIDKPNARPLCTRCLIYESRDNAGHVDGLCWPCRYDDMKAEVSRLTAELDAERAERERRDEMIAELRCGIDDYWQDRHEAFVAEVDAYLEARRSKANG